MWVFHVYCREERRFREGTRNSSSYGTVLSDGIRSVYFLLYHRSESSVSPYKLFASEVRKLYVCCSRRALFGTAEVCLGHMCIIVY